MNNKIAQISGVSLSNPDKIKLCFFTLRIVSNPLAPHPQLPTSPLPSQEKHPSARKIKFTLTNVPRPQSKNNGEVMMPIMRRH